MAHIQQVFAHWLLEKDCTGCPLCTSRCRVAEIATVYLAKGIYDSRSEFYRGSSAEHLLLGREGHRLEEALSALKEGVKNRDFKKGGRLLVLGFHLEGSLALSTATLTHLWSSPIRDELTRILMQTTTLHLEEARIFTALSQECFSTEVPTHLF